MRRGTCLRQIVHIASAAAILVGGLQIAAQKSDAMRQADAAFKAGYSAHAAGNLDEARRNFARVTHLAPQIAEGHQALAAVYIELGRAPEALPELEAALRLKPRDAEIEAGLAEAYAQTRQPAKALPHFELALSLAKQ